MSLKDLSLADLYALRRSTFDRYKAADGIDENLRLSFNLSKINEEIKERELKIVELKHA